MRYRAGIFGAAGFAGIECLRILLGHPVFDVEFIASDANAGERVCSAYPAFIGIEDMRFISTDDALCADIDVAFLAVPHTASLELTPKLIAKDVSVIDLSADFRLKDAATYERWYGEPHTSKDLLARAAFGLPEIHPDDLMDAQKAHESGEPVVVACAGCYPTATSLAAFPAISNGIIREDGIVVVDAISGVTGAGKRATARTHFCFANGNVEAYGVASHRHTPEIEQILGLENRVIFTPHLAPLDRGLLSTVNLPMNQEGSSLNTADILEIYRKQYAESSFVSVLDEGQMPRTASVVGSNRAHIGLAIDERCSMLIAVCAIDNLCKGAAGQAIQCANIVFGLPETEGLDSVSLAV